MGRILPHQKKLIFLHEEVHFGLLVVKLLFRMRAFPVNPDEHRSPVGQLFGSCAHYRGGARAPMPPEIYAYVQVQALARSIDHSNG